MWLSLCVSVNVCEYHVCEFACRCVRVWECVFKFGCMKCLGLCVFKFRCMCVKSVCGCVREHVCRMGLLALGCIHTFPQIFIEEVHWDASWRTRAWGGELATIY